MSTFLKKWRVGDELTAKRLNEIVDAINRHRHLRVSGGLSMFEGPSGWCLSASHPTLVRIAKVGGTPIPAMFGVAPGSGDVTLYTMGGSELSEGPAETAYNLHPTEPVSADAWVKLIDIDGKWFVFWEPC